MLINLTTYRLVIYVNDVNGGMSTMHLMLKPFFNTIESYFMFQHKRAEEIEKQPAWDFENIPKGFCDNKMTMWRNGYH